MRCELSEHWGKIRLCWNREQKHSQFGPEIHHWNSEFFMTYLFSINQSTSSQYIAIFSLKYSHFCWKNIVFLFIFALWNNVDSFFCLKIPSSIHNIHINTEANFAAGQRIYVQGKLRSTKKELDSGKNVTSSVIKAYQLYVLENESASMESTGGDQNNVELLTNIASDVINKDSHSTFAVATHFKVR